MCRNAEKILGFLNTDVLSKELIPPHINFSHLSAQDYEEMYGVIKTVKEDGFDQLGLDACLLEDELNKVSEPDVFMFSSLSVCLFVCLVLSKITPKQLSGLLRCVMVLFKMYL